MTTKEPIVAKAIELLQEHPHGLRYTQLRTAIHTALPDAHPKAGQAATYPCERLASYEPDVIFIPVAHAPHSNERRQTVANDSAPNLYERLGVYTALQPSWTTSSTGSW